jgi:hypothetical protein
MYVVVMVGFGSKIDSEKSPLYAQEIVVFLKGRKEFAFCDFFLHEIRLGALHERNSSDAGPMMASTRNRVQVNW